MSSHDLFNVSQHGFLPCRSTLTQILLSSYDWFVPYNRSVQVDVVNVDFSKAFDTVCHGKLILDLETYGVSGALLRRLRSFLTGRSFPVKVGDSLSNSLPVSNGVPQRSVLDPLLFLIYINDQSDSVVSTCKIFANDFKIYRPIGDPVFVLGILQDDLDRLSVWSRTWQLGVSHGNCSLLRVGARHDCCLKIEGHSLNSSIVRDLGANFDLALQRGYHCRIVSAKAMRVVNCLLRSLCHNSVEQFCRAFATYVRPVLEYCAQVW